MSSSNEVRVGVIGAGMIGNSHLRNYQKIDGVRVVAVCDLNEAGARQAAAEHGVEHVYTDYHELLQRDDLDAVDVCLHNALHRPVSVAAMEAGKHVYCEKPIAATYADGRAMLDAARQTGQMLHVQVATMFGADNRAAAMVAEGGRLGEVYHGRAYVNLRRRRPYVDGSHTAPFTQKAVAGGGAMIDWGIYAICQVLYLMGNPTPARISGVTYDKIPMHPGRRAEAGYDVEEMAAGFVRFENGASLDVLAAWAMHADQGPGNLVVGTEGGLSLPPLGWGGGQPVRFLHHDAALDLPLTSELDAGWVGSRRASLEGYGDAYNSPQHHWVAVLQGRVDLLPTAAVALNMIHIANGIYLSQELGREVTAEEAAAYGETPVAA